MPMGLADHLPLHPASPQDLSDNCFDAVAGMEDGLAALASLPNLQVRLRLGGPVAPRGVAAGSDSRLAIGCSSAVHGCGHG